MAELLYPNVGALELATTMQTALAACEIHLFQAGTVTLNAQTVLADLTAVEADFDGYAAEVVAAWLDPLLASGGGASIQTGTVQFAIIAPFTTSNVIQGWWIESAGGDLICCGDFPETISLIGLGDGIPMNVELVFG